MIPQLKEIWPEPHVDYNRYIEPFAGGLACFFAFPKVKENIFNDKDNRIANFYRVAIERPDELAKKVESTLLSQDEFNRAREIMRHPENHDEMERAWGFWVLSEMSHYHLRFSFMNVKNDYYPVDGYYNKIKNFSKNVSKLKNTISYNADAKEIILKGNENTLIFVDPPYPNSVQGTYLCNKFHQKDLDELSEILINSPSKIIFTIYKDNLDLNLFLENGWEYKIIEKICTFYHRPFKDRKEEIILYNYTPRNSQRKLFNIKDGV